MMIEAVGALTASCSAVAMPSMPGMLMSSRITSVGFSPATLTASSPELTLLGHDHVVLEAEQLGEVVPRLDDVVDDHDFDGFSHDSCASLSRRRLGRRDRKGWQHAVLVDELAQSDAAGRDRSGRVVGRRAEHQGDATVDLREADHFDLLRLDGQDGDQVGAGRGGGTG